MKKIDEGEIDRRYLSFEEACEAIADGDYVHTFKTNAFAMIGADWKRDAVIEALKTGKPELAGPTAARMKHGIVINGAAQGETFIATKADVIAKFDDAFETMEAVKP